MTDRQSASFMLLLKRRPLTESRRFQSRERGVKDFLHRMSKILHTSPGHGPWFGGLEVPAGLVEIVDGDDQLLVAGPAARDVEARDVDPGIRQASGEAAELAWAVVEGDRQHLL